MASAGQRWRNGEYQWRWLKATNSFAGFSESALKWRNGSLAAKCWRNQRWLSS